MLEFFDDGLDRFQEVDNVSGGTAGTGLGPRFNFNQCAACHSQPTFGGSSPANNPEAAVISAGIVSSSTNSIPSFITATGPTREARFPFFFNANGTANTAAPNGGVEDLYTVSGRADAGSCSLQQPSFATAQAANNLIFRIPTPVFGAGLVENIDDSTLLNNQSAQTGNGLGISGTFNRNGNDGTIARFGWKAQNKSLELFAGEAYNVEMGITNEIFPQDRPLPGEEVLGNGLPTNCLNLARKGYPEDITNFAATTGSDQFATNASIPSDVIAIHDVHEAAGAADSFNDGPGRSHLDLARLRRVQLDRLLRVPHPDSRLHPGVECDSVIGKCSGRGILRLRDSSHGDRVERQRLTG